MVRSQFSGSLLPARLKSWIHSDSRSSAAQRSAMSGRGMSLGVSASAFSFILGNQEHSPTLPNRSPA